MYSEMLLMHTEDKDGIGEFKLEKADIFSLGIPFLRIIL